MKELKQRKNFVTRKFRLTRNKVFYSIKEKGDLNEVDVQYEYLTKTKMNAQTNKVGWFFFGILFNVVGLSYILMFLGESTYQIGGLTFMIIGLIFLWIWHKTKEYFWKIKLTNDTFMYIHKNIPSDEDVNKFLDELYIFRDKYLIEEYANFPINLTYDQKVQNLNFLKHLEAINKTEYDVRIKKLGKNINKYPGLDFNKISKN